MRIVVIGGGVVGVTSAYYLAKAGHDVTLIEQHEEAGLGVSAGNGGQLTYAYVDPLAGPELWSKFPSILLGLDSAVRMRPDLSVDTLRWCLAFLWQCTTFRQAESVQSLLRLALESSRALASLQAGVPLEFDYTSVGKVILYRSRQALDLAGRLAEIKRQAGFPIELLDRGQCLALEPALDHYDNPFCGGVYAPNDAAGDCAKFTRGLWRHLRDAMGVDVRSRTKVVGLTIRGGRVAGIRSDRGEETADVVVLANGIEAPHLAATVKLRLPIEPVRGYSITAPVLDDAPKVSMTDRTEKIVFARLGDRLRVAAFADMDGWSPTGNPKRLAQLRALTRRLFPTAADWDRAEPVWSGQRPMTPSGMPIIGRSPVPGLYLNIGHGGLGWTLSCGAAARLAGEIG